MSLANNTIIIKPIKRLSLDDFKEIWRYRELFFFLAWRDVKVRYKQTALGILWAILQPFFTMIVFSIFFGKVAGISGGDIPYPIFVYTGLVFWNYFANSLGACSGSLIAEQNLIQKMYFPKIIVPIASTLVFLIDFFFAFLIFIGMLFYFHFSVTLTGVLLFFPALIITFLSFSGLGLIFASVNIKYRDVRYALPFFIQLLIFFTPVIYSTDILSNHQWLWYLNPMSGVIETMRAGLLGVGSINWNLFASSALLSFFLFLFGTFYFKKSEKNFADII